MKKYLSQNQKIMRSTSYIYQTAYEMMLGIPKTSTFNKISIAILNKFCNLIAKINDPLVKVNLGNSQLLLPMSHKLPIHLKEHPYYCSNLGRIARYVKKKYPKLKVIDIGANIGDSVAFLRTEVNFPVLCVEGDNFFFEILQKNQSSLPNIEIIQAYIGDKNEKIDLAVDNQHGTAQINEKSESTQETEILNLSTVIEKKPFYSDAKMIKIDTDGYDGRIIKGATPFLKSAKPIIFFEYDPFHLNNHNDDGFSIFTTLQNVGYQKIMIYDNLGKYMLSCDTNNMNTIKEIHTYFLGNSGNSYCDVCAFHGEDIDLYQEIRDSELSFFSKTLTTY